MQSLHAHPVPIVSDSESKQAIMFEYMAHSDGDDRTARIPCR
jgi:hypothetical protein